MSVLKVRVPFPLLLLPPPPLGGRRGGASLAPPPAAHVLVVRQAQERGERGPRSRAQGDEEGGGAGGDQNPDGAVDGPSR